MPREYRNISQYEKEIVELRSQGFTFKEIGEKYGFTFKQLHNFFTRYNKKQEKETCLIKISCNKKQDINIRTQLTKLINNR